jgi:hypothetical protein
VSDDQPVAPIGAFFVEELRYDIGTLTVVLSISGRAALEVVFAPPRAFRSFSESDYWHYLAEYDGEVILSSEDRGCGVLLSENAPYLLDYMAHVREQEPETNFSCLIKTPQECVEVICFERPQVREHPDP